MIRELERETQKRLQKAYEALRLPDPEGYTGTVEREYQKELARNLQKDGIKAANASTDQLIVGKLKAAGFNLNEIEKIIEQCSPMAVKPIPEQCQIYAKTIIQKAYFPTSIKLEKQLEEHRLDQLGIETKVRLLPENEPELLTQFNCIHMDRFYLVYEFCDRTIHLPKDVVIGDDGYPISVFFISQATYQDSNEPLQASDSVALENCLANQALEKDIDIIME